MIMLLNSLHHDHSLSVMQESPIGSFVGRIPADGMQAIAIAYRAVGAIAETTSVILEDFDHFDALPTHGVAGTKDVREFAGGFTHLGFFEPEESVYRAPAGSASETVSDHKIETTLFEIFY